MLDVFVFEKVDPQYHSPGVENPPSLAPSSNIYIYEFTLVARLLLALR